MKHSKCRVPNTLIQDTQLSYSARRLGCVFFSFSNALGTCRKSYDELAKLAHCSTKTAVSGVQQLIDAGYITRCNTYRNADGKVVYGKNVYSTDLNRLQDGYTLIPRSAFQHELKDAAFISLMAIYVCAGNATRAFPSISKLQKMTGAARSTVCAGLRLLKKLSTLLVQLCVKINRQFAANSYILVQNSMPVPSEACSGLSGGLHVPFQNITAFPTCKALNFRPLPKLQRVLFSLKAMVVRFLHNKVKT